MTGQSRAAQALERSEAGVTVALALQPYQSQLLVFASPKLPVPPVEAAAQPALDLSTDWKVSFAADQPAIAMPSLRSWTDDAATRNYSGLATYEKSFDLPKEYAAPGAQWQLDLGEAKPLSVKKSSNGMQTWLDAPVRDAAVVYVNGRRVGAIPPYRLDIRALLKPGANQLKIVVGNTASNVLAGQPRADYKALSAQYGERFKPQDMDNLQPLPSGLTGPIRLYCNNLKP